MGLDLWIERRYDDGRKPTELMYWRKAYPIMDWFESNYNNIVNCEPYKVTNEDIKGLLSFCNTILSDDSFSELDNLDIVEWCDNRELSEWKDWHMDWVKDTKKWCESFLDGDGDDSNIYFIAWW